ncbi:DUF7134 domain-containing protein, partial [Streptomyces flaveus]|uniref:DUF7134 domain-containing protein n=1 Tax=Streptomyces flaveus TaxID=66370 RepID=UPI004032F546
YTTLFYDTGYDQLIGLSMALAVVFRRRAPLTVMAVVAALALTQYLLAALAEPLAGELTGYDIAVLIAMVTVVSRAEEMWRAYTAGGIVSWATCWPSAGSPRSVRRPTGTSSART